MLPESLDEIQKLVENKFEGIQNTQKSYLHFPGHPCTPEHLQVFLMSLCGPLFGSFPIEHLHLIYDGKKNMYIKKKALVLLLVSFVSVNLLQILVKAVPIKQGHKLRIIWPITPGIRYYKEGPCRYIGHLMGHEGEGSLFSILKTLGEFCF